MINQERSIVASDLMAAMRLFVSNLKNPTLTPYALSIDHSPSEQIDGSEWHSSALIISQSMEHQALADIIGKRINQNGGCLRQWKKSTQSYRKKFHEEFFNALKDFPIIAVVVSSKEKVIIASEDMHADQLGIAGFYRRIRVNEKTKVEFGPFRFGENEPIQTLTVSDKHAPMGIFIANYLLRTHNFLNRAIQEKIGTANFSLWMDVWSDRPPSNFSGPYGELMLLLLGGGNAQGKFTFGGFTECDNQPIDLLADNLAGLCNENILNPGGYKYSGPGLSPPITGVFYHEMLE